MNPYPTEMEMALERFCEDGLLDACWDQFRSNGGDPFAVFGNTVIELLRWARTEGAFQDRRLDAASEKAVHAMETLTRSVNKSVQRGELEVLDAVEHWPDLDLWWVNEPLLPRPVRNAVNRAKRMVTALIEYVELSALPAPLREKMHESVRRAYEDLMIQLWREDHPRGK